jgi:hypothetical protein
MNFLIESLKGKTLKDIEMKAITDREVNLLRNYLYRPPKKIESHIGGQIHGGGKKKVPKKKITDKDKKEKKKVSKKKITDKDKKEKKKVSKKKTFDKDKQKK